MPKGRILAVDDQRYFRELIEVLLTEEGFEAQTAASGEEALHLLEHASFDVVVTDLVMPGMDGAELVHRIKQRDPDQDVVVVTGVVDVKTAVEAMRIGATDYLLKPFERTTLSAALERILQRRRMRIEHERLLAENIEYMGERSLFERAIGLFSSRAVEPLAVRIVEALCLETQAQGGVLWVASEEAPDTLVLAGARGLVRPDEEPERVEIRDLPKEFREGVARSSVQYWGEAAPGARPALYLSLRSEGRLIGLARLTDKLRGEDFDSVDRACGEKLLRFGEMALASALHIRRLERRSLRDPESGAYSLEYFEDVSRTEIEKANRFGRSFSLLRVDVTAPSGEGGAEARRASLPKALAGLLRSTDVVAQDGPQRLFALLPEVDAIGAILLKRRVWDLLEAQLRPGTRKTQPACHVGVATYPVDGTQLESLRRTLDQRLAEESVSPVRALGLAGRSLEETLACLLEQGEPWDTASIDHVARFVLAEAGRRPQDGGLLVLGPGRALAEAVAEGLRGLEGIAMRREIIALAEGGRPVFEQPVVQWVAPTRIPGLPPFLVHYGEGPAYALVRAEKETGKGATFFHTCDRSLVEHLAFRLREELGVSLGRT